MQNGLVYHICRQQAWEEALRLGRYSGSAEDRRDGFIHFSGGAQVRESAARHHSDENGIGRSGLVLLAADSARLGAALRWEKSRGGALFPHLYGDLPVEAVVEAQPLPVDPATGRHCFPSCS